MFAIKPLPVAIVSILNCSPNFLFLDFPPVSPLDLHGRSVSFGFGSFVRRMFCDGCRCEYDVFGRSQVELEQNLRIFLNAF
jgi:hypothetical protein